ncbi:MAG TPA: hypothetical protein VNA89_00855 [Gemmatimonadaceae bacterium]|nr:hypothetical protein [Gemmatimonadaceae bacterium]
MTALGRLVCLTSLLAAAGCRDRAEAEGTGGPYARRVAEYAPQIERAVGLEFKSPPRVERRTRDEVRGFLLKQIEGERAQRDLAGQSAAYKRLGLLPDTLDLRAVLLDLLQEQVAGYYDPKTKVLYVVGDAPPEVVGITIAHELIHALQDQYVNLDSLLESDEANDRKTAAQAVMEGQATYEQLASMGGGANLAARLPGGWEQMREMIRQEQGSMPRFAAAPTLLQETLLFPYLGGADFMRRFEERRRDTVPFSDMPTSTEQILHTGAYFGQPRDEPTTITLPPPREGTTTYDNNLGEFETRLFLFQHLKDQDAALRGATGWDGDRYAVVRTPRGDGVVWVTVWDTPVDAAEFTDLLEQAINLRYQPASRTTLSPELRTFAVAGRTVSRYSGEVSGRALVAYVDFPAGSRPDPIDLARVTLAEGRR